MALKDITKNSIILNLTMKKSNEKVSIDNVNYIPIHMYKNTAATSKKFKVLDIQNTLKLYESGAGNINKSTYEYLKKQLDSINSIVSIKN